MSVEQAAERLRRWGVAVENGGRHYHEYGEDIDGEYMRASDENTLRDWAIAMNDQRPLTEAILRASGWEVPEGYSVYMRHQIAGGLFFEKHTGAYFEAFKGYVKTVGDLRRLLSALHIDCAVVVPESEVA